VIITDADTKFTNTTISNLVKPFSNRNIGCVTGQVIFVNEGSGISKSQCQYWNYELVLRKFESDLGVLAVAAGPCMAFRRDCFSQMPTFAGDDCVIPLQIVLKGKRVMQSIDAIAFDQMEVQAKKEFRTRVRMTLRNWMGTLYYKKLLNPLIWPKYAFSLFFHKILRWLSPFFLLFSTFSLFFIEPSGIYLLFMYFFALFYLAGLVGAILELFKIKAQVFSMVFSFFLANYAFLIGFFKLINRDVITTYQSGK
jgi:cellulose synthase/poly-beta-1,6-N-acetylglucosamine synthase-like glycosyltransferase